VNEPLPGLEGAMLRWGAKVPPILAGSLPVGEFSTARPGTLLRSIPGVARLLARDGTIVEIDAEASADRALIMSLVQGPVTAALIHQRGELPLHGATLVHPARGIAYAFVGPQGAGKSTLAFALAGRGWHLLSDDLTRVTTDQNGVRVWTGRSGIKLCADACDGFGLDRARMAALPGWRGKFLATVEPIEGGFPLGAIFVLNRGGAPASIEPGSASAMALLSMNTMRVHYVKPLGTAKAHLAAVVQICTMVPMLYLTTKDSPSTVAERIELLTDELVTKSR
jgi:hypothetical protein